MSFHNTDQSEVLTAKRFKNIFMVFILTPGADTTTNSRLEIVKSSALKIVQANEMCRFLDDFRSTNFTCDTNKSCVTKSYKSAIFATTNFILDGWEIALLS